MQPQKQWTDEDVTRMQTWVDDQITRLKETGNYSNTLSISWNTFEERFDPIFNMFDDGASWNGCMFETYGDELQFVLAQDPTCIWTIVDDGEDSVLTSGYHLVNRLGYIVTRIPYPKTVFINVE